MNHSEKKGGLAIAGFATSAGGIVLSLTGIGAFIGIPAIIVGFILSLVALVKKQKHQGLSIAGIVLSLLAIIGIVIFFMKMKEYATPLIQSGEKIEALMENDPELKELMKDKNFNDAFQENLKKRMEARKNELDESATAQGKNISIINITTQAAKILEEESILAIQETKAEFAK